MARSHEQLPTRISEVDFGERTKWVAGYIAQIETSERISDAIAGYDRIGDSLTGLQQDVLGVADLAIADTRRIMQDPLNYAGDPDKITESSLPVFRKTEAIVTDAHVQIDNMDKALKRNARVFGLVNEREQALGNQMRNIPPAMYAVQAIGQNHPVIDRRWTQVRAEIELFRHFTGQTDPEITLGQSCSEEWAVHTRDAFIFNIGRIQVAQVMLGPDCEQSAASLGIGQLLDICGKPPLLSDEEIGRQLEQTPTDTWMHNAHRVIGDIERPYL